MAIKISQNTVTIAPTIILAVLIPYATDSPRKNANANAPKIE
nr:MAG TPA: hypothetical protein [Caudoviricetes sp.]